MTDHPAFHRWWMELESLEHAGISLPDPEELVEREAFEHVLRTPLTTVQGYISILRAHYTGEDRLPDHVCSRMLEVVAESVDELNLVISYLAGVMFDGSTKASQDGKANVPVLWSDPELSEADPEPS